MSTVPDAKPSPDGAEAERFFAAKPVQLMRTQRRAVYHVIGHLSRLVLESMDHRARELPRDTTERPHQVFLLDGGRGSGKTFTLSSVQFAIEELSRQCFGVVEVDADWKTFFFDEKTGIPEARTLLAKLPASRSPRARFTDCMRIIFQNDLVDKESIMETIFGYMSRTVEQERDKLKEPGRGDRTMGADRSSDSIERLDRLLRKLADVAKGWYFARRFGLDALVRDSMDYADMVDRWTEESRRAAGRIDSWRQLIDEYLDVIGREVFVVLLDDSDVDPKMTAQVIDDIRMFLVHPRIVTVLAGNLSTMRESLLHERLRDLAASMPTLNGANPTAIDWRRRIRQLVEDYLEKVLPPQRRLHITRPEHREAHDDFELVAARPLLAYMEAAIGQTRKAFLDTKFKLAIAHLLGRPDTPTTAQRRQLDNFLAWWFFAHIYADLLAPHSPRQIATFRDYYYPPLFTKRKEGDLPPRMKRLPIVLFENPANFLLTQRFGDEDVSVLGWLRSQDLKSAWSGRRQLTVNQRDIGEGSYSYTFLRYQLDVGLGLPVRKNADEVIPVGLLPHPAGRQLMRRFLQPRATPRRQRLLGVSSWIKHAAIPGNCAYFNDLQALPDGSFVDAGASEEERDRLQSGGWEAQLAERWQDLLDDAQETPDDEYMILYFREIVCQSLYLTADLSSAALLNELDPTDILEKQRMAVYEHFIGDELGMFAASASERRLAWLKPRQLNQPSPAFRAEFEMLRNKQDHLTGLSLFSPMKDATGAVGYNWPPLAPLRMIALYTALVTDLRRAWHAIRIHEVSPVHMGGTEEGSGHETGQRAAFAVLRSQDRMTLYRLDDIVDILRRSEWVGAMLQVFAQQNVKNTIDGFGMTDKFRKGINLTPDELGALFSPEGLIGGPAVLEEPVDFNRWTKSVRAVGRLACRGWPVHDRPEGESPVDEDREKKKAEEREAIFFHNALHERDSEFEFSVLKPAGNLTEKEKETRHHRLLKNSRAARNFVWLMYGLAPSLAAVLHTHVMSRIYEAEKLQKACDEGKGGRIEAADIETMQKRVCKHYMLASEDLEEWAELIGSISILIRYIKIKCLHLDTALLIKALHIDGEAEPAVQEEELKDRVQLLRTFGYLPEADSGEALTQEKARTTVTTFISTVATFFRTDQLENGLAIFPDVAPSTLLGDGWLEDILTRPALRSQLKKVNIELNPSRLKAEVNPDGTPQEDPLSVSGIFGETELWLWSASRSLRKLGTALAARRIVVDPEFARSRRA